MYIPGGIMWLGRLSCVCPLFPPHFKSDAIFWQDMNTGNLSFLKNPKEL
jgi:hypothetical protein